MKTRLILFFVFLIGMAPMVYSDSTHPTPPPPNNNNGNGTVLVPNPPKQKPNSSTSNDVVVCRIVDNSFMFELPSGIESASVSIYNDRQGWIGVITPNDNSFEIPFISDVYYIDCFANDGTTYSGILNITD